MRVFPDAPAGFNTRREGVPAGRIEAFEYESSVTGTRRKANVYLPPGYSSDKKYPVLYLLHGIGGDETEWIRFATPDALFDNLIADKKAEPMIVVIPNGRALADDSASGNTFAPEKVAGFARFEQDLLENLIPAIEKKYSALHRSRASRPRRPLDGRRPDAQLRSRAPRHVRVARRILVCPEHQAARRARPGSGRGESQAEAALSFVREQDGLINISQGVHAYLKQHNVPHIWNVDDEGHTPKTWASNLYHFAQRIFR